VPLLDGVLSELARGAALRRVALRHGVTLTPPARSILAGTGATRVTSTGRARLLKAAVSSAVAPFRIASRLEDAAGTLFGAALLDRYLTRRRKTGPITRAEAEDLRDAMEEAVVATGFDALREVPLGVFDVIRDAVTAAVARDREGRSRLEVLVDALLDGAAEAPDDLLGRLGAHFDDAMPKERVRVEVETDGEALTEGEEAAPLASEAPSGETGA
jgi:hypothetical protein